MSSPQFSGSIVALVTPMHPDGAIDWESLAQLVAWHIDAGTRAIVAVGTTGESPTLTMAEHTAVIAKVIEYAAGKIPVIAGTGANSTAEAIELTVQACTDGAAACLVVVPYYNKPTQQGLYEHFVAVADAATKPVIVYNVPSRTITDLADTTLARLAAHDNILGIKDATGDLARLAWQQANINRPDFCYLSGDDATCAAYVAGGGHGVISVTSNVAPKIMATMIAATASSDPQATELNAQVAPFHQVQGLESNPIPVKWALHKQGRIGTGIRLPLTPLAAEYHEQVQAALTNLH